MASNEGLSTEQLIGLWELIAAVARTAQLVSMEDVNKLQQSIDYANNIGPFVDPTAWMRGHHNLDDQEVLLNGFREFRKAIEKIKLTSPSQGGPVHK